MRYYHRLPTPKAEINIAIQTANRVGPLMQPGMLQLLLALLTVTSPCKCRVRVNEVGFDGRFNVGLYVLLRDDLFWTRNSVLLCRTLPSWHFYEKDVNRKTTTICRIRPIGRYFSSIIQCRGAYKVIQVSLAEL